MEIDAEHLLRQQKEQEKEEQKKHKIEEELKNDSVNQDKNFPVVSSCYLEINNFQNLVPALSKSSSLLSFVSTSNNIPYCQLKDNTSIDSNYQIQKIYNQGSKVNFDILYFNTLLFFLSNYLFKIYK